HWQNITPAGLPECLINAIEVSPFDKATAYIATTRYKFNDYTPGLYKTTDYGKTWIRINNGIPDGAFTRVVREDDKRKDLLFAGLNNYRGVNPSTGVVIYYQLPELKDSVLLTLEIRDASGNLVHSYSSKKDSTYKKYDGGPPAEPVLSQTKGLNRFVWNMRYS